ncbi:MAG: polysaccharide deacetylase family protein [Flavobacterium sp.]|nr:MAG: polysaccharide deacetylase family protein [Flavobacterium sp.]
MKSYLVKTPKFVQRIFPERVWAFPNNNNFVYLTFDDGPIPEITPWVLSLLKKHQAKATFFCIGDNVKKHPEVFKQIITEGHSVGNHTFNHLNGWKIRTEKYIDNCLKFNEILPLFPPLNDNSALTTPSSVLFRPPFGKMTSKQSKILQKKGYKIIMWDVLSADFDATISKEKCLENVLTTIQEGSVIVFHDSLKAADKLKYVLPKVLEYIKEAGFICKAISV